MATARVLVQRALDDLSRTLKPEDARFFRETALGDLWKEMRAIEHEQGQRLDMRFMRRLEPFLETMESYSKVIEVFCQGFSPMAFVWVRRQCRSSAEMLLTCVRGPSSLCYWSVGLHKCSSLLLSSHLSS